MECVVDSHGIEAVFAARLEKPRPERRSGLQKAHASHSEPLSPSFTVVVLIPEVGVKVIDSQCQECIAFGRD